MNKTFLCIKSFSGLFQKGRCYETTLDGKGRFIILSDSGGEYKLNLLHEVWADTFVQHCELENK